MSAPLCLALVCPGKSACTQSWMGSHSSSVFLSPSLLAPVPHLKMTKLLLLLRVFITATLCATGWWDSKTRYWSVWVALQHTEVLTVPSSLPLSWISRKANLSSDSSSTVNCTHCSIRFRWSRKGYIWSGGRAAQLINIALPKMGRWVKGGQCSVLDVFHH